jgi:hypothetical protein
MPSRETERDKDVRDESIDEEREDVKKERSVISGPYLTHITNYSCNSQLHF